MTRKLTQWIALVGALLALPLGVSAFEPTKTVEGVVHTAPGGGSDILARAIAEMLQKEKLITQRLQVVNKSGGGSAVAMSYLAEKKGDNHVIGFFTGVWVTNPLTTKEATVTIKDLTTIVRLVLEPAVVAVKADSPFKSMKDFVEAAKKSPGQLRQSGGSVPVETIWCARHQRPPAQNGYSFLSVAGGASRESVGRTRADDVMDPRRPASISRRAIFGDCRSDRKTAAILSGCSHPHGTRNRCSRYSAGPRSAGASGCG
jgi:putative tricarboxylic transport membrane protein